MKRREWKLDLIQKAQERRKLPAVEIKSVGPITAEKEFLTVRATGKYIHEKEMLVGPRTRNDKIESQSSIMGGGLSNVGYLCFTPFKIDDNQVILVNRGFIPSEDVADEARKDPETVTIEGVIRQGEPKGRLILRNDPKYINWYSIDLDDMAEYANTSKTLIELSAGCFVINLDAEVNKVRHKPGFPLMRVPQSVFRNHHLEYAITWFGLSFASTTFLLFRKRFR